jgi:hypothetical protein
MVPLASCTLSQAMVVGFPSDDGGTVIWTHAFAATKVWLTPVSCSPPA